MQPIDAAFPPVPCFAIFPNIRFSGQDMMHTGADVVIYGLNLSQQDQDRVKTALTASHFKTFCIRGGAK
jgi:hypothetical protein